MTWERDVGGLAAAALEVGAVLAGIDGAGSIALALHLASCGSVALAVRGRAFEGPAAWSLALGLSLFVPVLGALGVAVLAVARWPLASSPGHDLVRTRIPGWSEIPWPLDAASASSEGSDRSSRLARVAAARGRGDAGAVALLRRALCDPDEDVRLLAHALLEAKSRAAYRNVHEGGRELAAAPASLRPAIRRRLAIDHFELARLGLAQGECLGHALGSARQHALAAIEADPRRASLHLLLGRVELRRGEARAAEAALLRAAGLGLAAPVVQPYLAECAFLARRFDLVRRRLADAGPAASPAVSRLRSYWS